MRFWAALLLGASLFLGAVGVVRLQDSRPAGLAWLAGAMVTLWLAQGLWRGGVNRAPAAPLFHDVTAVLLGGAGWLVCAGFRVPAPGAWRPGDRL